MTIYISLSKYQIIQIQKLLVETIPISVESQIRCHWNIEQVLMNIFMRYFHKYLSILKGMAYMNTEFQSFFFEKATPVKTYIKVKSTCD